MDLKCEERSSGSPLVECIWRTCSEHAGSFISMADTHAWIVVTKYRGKTVLSERGSLSRSSPAHYPVDAEFIGFRFKHGTLFMPGFPAATVMDRRDVTLPETISRSFWLKGSI